MACTSNRVAKRPYFLKINAWECRKIQKIEILWRFKKVTALHQRLALPDGQVSLQTIAAGQIGAKFLDGLVSFLLDLQMNKKY